MIERLENIIVPKVKLTSRTEDDNPELDNFKCRRLLETYIKDYLPESKSVIIMWVDKNNMLSTAYCNVSPLKRLELYVVGWLQELFDIKVKHGKE
jgi:hypothetical protein